jgi:hypothetical protein
MTLYCQTSRRLLSRYKQLGRHSAGGDDADDEADPAAADVDLERYSRCKCMGMRASSLCTNVKGVLICVTRETYI